MAIDKFNLCSVHISQYSSQFSLDIQHILNKTNWIPNALLRFLARWDLGSIEFQTLPKRNIGELNNLIAYSYSISTVIDNNLIIKLS